MSKETRKKNAQQEAQVRTVVVNTSNNGIARQNESVKERVCVCVCARRTCALSVHLNHFGCDFSADENLLKWI